MLPFNRVYTPDELRAMSRLTPADPQASLLVARTTTQLGARGRRETLVTALRRLFGRTGVRRSAPGTV
jgi:hypothetical protein